MSEIKDKGDVSDTPSPSRLVIRIKLPAQTPAETPVRQPLNKGLLLLVLGPVAALLIWLGISVFRSEPTPEPAATTPAVTAEVPQPAAQPVEPPRATAARPVESEVRKQSAAPTLPINEVVPDASPGARDTIRGTIRVTVRVILNKDGTVLAATADEPGPSRYFERLSLEAAKQWTFTPAASEEQRVMLLRFYFRRSGTTANASSP
jgi:TonB family protein